MPSNTASLAEEGVTASAPQNTNIRWFVCTLLFAATTINYMDRQIFSLIEPLLHGVPFMGWDKLADNLHQPVFDNNFGNVIICFQVAYGAGFLFAGRMIDKLGTKVGYAMAIGMWAIASLSHSIVTTVAGFCIARIFLGIGESGNFPAAIKATSEWFPTEERAKAVGIFNSGSNVSSIIAPALVAFVTAKWAWSATQWGWRAAFITSGSMGLLWLIIWIVFPYNRLRRGSTQTQANLEADFADESNGHSVPYSVLLRRPGLYAFSIGKALTDGVWWFYLFYLPQFLNRNYGLKLLDAYWYLVAVYGLSSIGSVVGGWLSGYLINRGFTVDAGRKIAMLICALLVIPVIFVPHFGDLFPHNAWPATMLIALAASAHQGWSANLLSTPGDLFPSSTVSTVVGVGGAAGALGGAAFTWIVKRNLSLHSLLVFSMAAGAYIVSLALFQLLVPKLGARSKGPALPQAI